MKSNGPRILLTSSIILLLIWPPPALPQQAKSDSLAVYAGADREQRLLEGARKEGKVFWYTSLTGGPNLEIPQVFEAKYPGVKVEVYRGSSDELAAKILAEAQAKRYLADTFEATFPILKVMRDYKLLAPFYSPHLTLYPEKAKQSAGKGLVAWATDRESYIGLAYNTNVIPVQAVPKTYGDLAMPELKGKLGFATTDTGGRVIGTMLALKGEAFVRSLKKQEIALHQISARAVLDLVISGEIGASPTVFLSHSRVSMTKGAPIKWVPMEVVPTNAGGVAVSAHAPHPNGALLLTDFLFSPEGQKLLGKFGLDSPLANPDFKRWYPEQGLSVEQYEKESDRWDKLLREIARK